ncbi:hypothetical protein SAMN05421788_102128 [Filimonas lacunae]|uniref:Lipoprotein n=1 Tax=Filimonas lacunae TaxID=477680 RepID=A0A173MIC5_9BACT|nr:hypothetical protein [Filimonas lacunae]BAV07249.1 hypothetical protein FLA_3272 [Filimonas lacunae]SIS92588.1 hypothetical protein SAMN05421788_102128 [Filimonas lacunae]
MQPKHILYTACLFLFLSCSSHTPPSPKQPYRDSALKAYIDHISQTPHYSELSNYDFSFLKAYYTNDTPSLQKAMNNIAWQKELTGDSFPPYLPKHPDWEKLQAEEAYQLFYYTSFCYEDFYFTIFKKECSIHLHAVIYRANYSHPSFQVEKEVSLQLTQKNWDKFTSLINYADFWGMQPHSEREMVLDGDYIKIKGFDKNGGRNGTSLQHMVSRNPAFNKAIYEPCKYLASLVHYRLGCAL